MLVTFRHPTPAQVRVPNRRPHVEQRHRHTAVPVHDGETAPRLQVIRKRACRPLRDGKVANRIRRMGVLAKVICLDCRYGWTENSRHTMLL